MLNISNNKLPVETLNYPFFFPEEDANVQCQVYFLEFGPGYLLFLVSHSYFSPGLKIFSLRVKTIPLNPSDRPQTI
jgi:hypothetical protein